MHHRTTVLAGTFALICCAHVARGQDASRPIAGAMVAAPKNPPARQTGNKPRIAAMPATPAVIPFQNGVPTAGFVNNIAPQVAAFYYLPTIVLTDGRVYGNFNGRYEQVLRRCPALSGQLPPGFTVSTCYTVDANGRYQVVQQR